MATGLVDADFKSVDNPLTQFIAKPDTFSVIVACFAGAAGMLSLTSAKSGALVGVLISVTTIPAAANIGVAAALGNWADWRGAMAQLSINLTGIVLAGVGTLYLERWLYTRRRRRHLGRRLAGRGGPARRPAGARRRAMTRQLAILLGAFAIGTAIAAALGAVSFGVALGIGQLCFAATLVWVLLRD